MGEVGEPITGEKLTFSFDGESVTLTTDAEGQAKIDNFPGAAALVRIVSVDSLEGKLKPRWGKPRDGALLRPRPVTEVVSLEASVDDISVGEGTTIISIQPRVKGTVELDIQPLPPIEEILGVQHRLNNLGYDCGDPSGELNEDAAEALRCFQTDESLEVTLTSLHGPPAGCVRPLTESPSEIAAPTPDTERAARAPCRSRSGTARTGPRPASGR